MSKERVKDIVRPVYGAALGKLPPKSRVAVQMLLNLRYIPKINNPRTFNEKINYRKLYSTNQKKFAVLSDKILAKEFVADAVGAQYVTPTIWSGRSLPDTFPGWEVPFVVKANHGSALNYFVRRAADLNWKSLKKITADWTGLDWPAHLHEEWYNRIDRKILVEPMIGDDPLDFKMFVFDAKVECIQVDTDRRTGHKRAFFSRDWERLPFTMRFPKDDRQIPKPKHLERMIELAEVLGRDMSFVRIDFYDLPDGPRFGEFTFSPGAGFERVHPARYDAQLGSLWKRLD